MKIKPNDRILIVDDNPSIHEDFQKILSNDQSRDCDAASLFLGSNTTEPPASMSFRTSSAYQGQEGLEQIIQAKTDKDPFSLAFVDMRMPPGWDGLETIENIWNADPDVQIVICTAYSDHSWSDIRKRVGQTDKLLILKKPFDNAEVSQLAVAMTEKWRLRQETRQLLDKQTGLLEDAQTKMKRHHRYLELATNLSSLGYLSFNLASKTLTLSPHCFEILGISSQGPSPHLEDFIDHFAKSDREPLSDLLDKAIHQGVDFDYKASVSSESQDVRYVQIRFICESDTSGGRSTLFGVMQDVTDSENAMLAVQHAATHDSLTRLANRSKFTQQLNLALGQASDSGIGTGLILLDLDHFKDVNDSHGHPTGDELLRAFADRVQSVVRSCDTVARLGGDEFAVVQSNAALPKDTLAVVDRIFDQMKLPFFINGKSVIAGVSAGIALTSGNKLDAESLFRNADVALYRAKQDGRGVSCFFGQEMDLRMQARRQIELDLKGATERNEFELYYQPVLLAAERRVSGMEALIRWNHPNRGIVFPNDFIEIAEKTGEILNIGRWVFEQACRDIASWPSDAKVAVNVSAIQFQQGNLLQTISDAINAAGVEPHQLEIEITETVFLNDTNENLQILSSLRNLGVSIAMDDFGIGHSSLSYLRSFRFDKLKLDRSFVLDSDDNQEARAIVSAVAALGQSLGMQTTAEGVETESQFGRVVAEGYTHVQGYLFGKPLPKTEFESRFLAKELLEVGE